MTTNLVASAIGRESFELLCAWVGGGDYNIPARTDSASAALLAENIGRHAADALIGWGAGSRVYVPYLHVLQLLRRRDELRTMRSRGLTIAEIARRYHYIGRYTERQIQTVLSLADDQPEGLPADQLQLV